MKNFDIDVFIKMNSSDVRHYGERLLQSQIDDVSFPESDADALLARALDESSSHATYALELCMMTHPARFIACCIQLLSHSSASVCCTAYRWLISFPNDMFTSENVNELNRTQVIVLYSDDFDDEAHQVGTNENFIKELQVKMGTSTKTE